LCYKLTAFYDDCATNKISVTMNVLQSELGLVKARFPTFHCVIDKLYRMDSDFKSLCADLFLCSKMIHDFELEISEKQHALAEYRDIVHELEKELEMVIETSET
jgi:hypothetical protein